MCVEKMEFIVVMSKLYVLMKFRKCLLVFILFRGQNNVSNDCYI
jgi:hypothetical protein